MKAGIEIEGKFKNVYSIFIHDVEIRSEKVREYLSTHTNYQHLCIYSPNWFLLRNDLEFLKKLKLDTNILITIETMEIPDILEEYRDVFNIMFMLINPEVFKLLKTDQIKILSSSTQHPPRVMAMCIENMYRTEPEEFSIDVDIKV